MVLAGLWENWRLPADEWVRTFAIVTTTPNELCAEIHNRMPVILKPEAWPVWLAEQPRRGDAEIAARPLPFRRQPARRQRQQQRSLVN
jgi:putative SOS response-associated peptidase YedK